MQLSTSAFPLDSASCAPPASGAPFACAGATASEGESFGFVLATKSHATPGAGVPSIPVAPQPSPLSANIVGKTAAAPAASSGRSADEIASVGVPTPSSALTSAIGSREAIAWIEFAFAPASLVLLDPAPLPATPQSGNETVTPDPFTCLSAGQAAMPPVHVAGPAGLLDETGPAGSQAKPVLPTASERAQPLAANHGEQRRPGVSPAAVPHAETQIGSPRESSRHLDSEPVGVRRLLPAFIMPDAANAAGPAPAMAAALLASNDANPLVPPVNGAIERPDLLPEQQTIPSQQSGTTGAWASAPTANAGSPGSSTANSEGEGRAERIRSVPLAFATGLPSDSATVVKPVRSSAASTQPDAMPASVKLDAKPMFPADTVEPSSGNEKRSGIASRRAAGAVAAQTLPSPSMADTQESRPGVDRGHNLELGGAVSTKTPSRVESSVVVGQDGRTVPSPIRAASLVAETVNVSAAAKPAVTMVDTQEFRPAADRGPNFEPASALSLSPKVLPRVESSVVAGQAGGFPETVANDGRAAPLLARVASLAAATANIPGATRPAAGTPGTSIVSSPIVRAPVMEKFAGRLDRAASPEGVSEKPELKNVLTASNEPVTNRPATLGTNVAKPESAMPAFAHPTLPPFTEVEPVSFSTMPLTFDALVEESMQPAAGELASSARRAVDSAMAIVDHFAGGSQQQRSVNLQFSVSGVELAVRVEMRADGVHTVFRTDSPELRAALAQEWNAVVPSHTADRAQRLAEPVFTSNSSGGPASGDSGASQQREPGPRQNQWETANSFAPPAAARAAVEAAVSAVPAAPPVVPRFTARHLHTFA